MESHFTSPLKTKSLHFAVQCVHFQKRLFEKKEFIISRQLLRSGTSIGANIREGQNAESTADFIHKLSIAQKECSETLYWLELLSLTNLITEQDYDLLNSQATELLKMLRSAILTTKGKLSKISKQSNNR